MKKQIILSAFLLFLIIPALGQTNRIIDSLENILRTAKADTAKVKCLNELSYQYLKVSEFKIAVQYAESALDLAKTLDYKKGIAYSYVIFGFSYFLFFFFMYPPSFIIVYILLSLAQTPWSPLPSNMRWKMGRTHHDPQAWQAPDTCCRTEAMHRRGIHEDPQF